MKSYNHFWIPESYLILFVFLPALSITMLVVVLHMIYFSDTSPVWLLVSGLFLGIRCLSRSKVTRFELHIQGAVSHMFDKPVEIQIHPSLQNACVSSALPSWLWLLLVHVELPVSSHLLYILLYSKVLRNIRLTKSHSTASRSHFVAGVQWVANMHGLGLTPVHVVL